MKFIVGVIVGVFCSFFSLYLYNQYLISQKPQKLVNWYVSCLAKHQNEIDRGKDKTKQTPLEICHLSDKQVQKIQEGL